MKFNTRSSARLPFFRALLLSLAFLAIAFVAFAQYPAYATANTVAINPNARGVGLPSALPSNTLFVTNTNNSGVGSLRNAIAIAGSGDTINFSLSGCPCVITLSSELPIFQSLNIVGLGESMLAIDGAGAFRVFEHLTTDPVSFSKLTIQNGKTTSGNSGAGIRTQNEITVTNVTFSNNSAGLNGGGIYNEGGTVHVYDSTFSSNSAGQNGGGIANYSGNVIVSGSTFSSNSATNDGGGIQNRAILMVTNSTFSGNSASAGGALSNEVSSATDFGVATLINVTFSGSSTSQRAIFNVTGIPSGVVNITNTIITNSATTTFNCIGVSGNGSSSNNIDIGNSCGFDHPNTDPLLAPLGNNGGPNQTMALTTGSPAIDAGDDTTCNASPVNGVDQRGLHRPAGPHCDIGAYEFYTYTLSLPLVIR